ALPGPPVPVGVLEGVQQLLLGLAVQPGALAPVAASGFQGGAALLLGVDRPLDACHVFVLFVGAAGGWATGRRRGPASGERACTAPCLELPVTACGARRRLTALSSSPVQHRYRLPAGNCSDAGPAPAQRLDPRIRRRMSDAGH